METPGLVPCGNSNEQVRVSPTLSVMREVCSEHITKKQQEPKILGFVAKDPAMIKAFSEGKDIYSTIASIAFNVPYEECLENHPITGEYQKEGKARRTQAKSIVLGRPIRF